MAYARPPPPNGAPYGAQGGYGNGGYQQDWGHREDYTEYSANPFSQGGGPLPPPQQQPQYQQQYQQPQHPQYQQQTQYQQQPQHQQQQQNQQQQQGYGMPRPHPNEQQGYLDNSKMQQQYDQYNRPPPRGDSRAGPPPQSNQYPYGQPPTAPPNRPLPQRDRYDQGQQSWDNQPPRDYGRPSTSQGNYAPPPPPQGQSNFDFGWNNGAAQPPRPNTSQDTYHDGYGARPPAQPYQEPTSVSGHYGAGHQFNLPERPGTAPSRDPYGSQSQPPDNRPYAHHMNGNGPAPYPAEEMPNFANAQQAPNARPVDPYSQGAGYDQRHMSPPYAQSQGPPPPRPNELQRQDTYYSDPGYNDGHGYDGQDGGYGYGADSYSQGPPPPDPRMRRDPRGPPPRAPPSRGGPRGRGPSRGGYREPHDPRDPRGRDAPPRGPPNGMDPRSRGRRPPPGGRPTDPRPDANGRPNGPPNGSSTGKPGAPSAGAAALAGGAIGASAVAAASRNPPRAPGQPKDPQQANNSSNSNIQTPTSPTKANPDALPTHPTPVRPGLMQNGSKSGNDRPPPVRQYTNTSSAPRQSGSSDRRSMPVTAQELESLRQQAASRPQDGALGLKLAKKLIEASSVLASDNGRADPRTTAKNRERYVLEAHKLLKKLAATENADAQFYLADCLGNGSLGLENDPKEAFQLYQSAAKLRHAQAAYRTAICCEIGPEEGGGTRKDPVKAIQWYKRAANLGDVDGMYKSGMICLEGLLGSERNPAEGVAWLQRAVEKADADQPFALHKLGQLYENPAALGYQVPLPRDDAKAFQLFSQAAKYGYKFSQFKLGQAYEYGMLGAPIDARQSIIWYTKAAAQGEHQAELALSGWYLTGSEGMLEHSDTEAYLWARKAATGDPPLPKALFALGYYTEVGIGCPRSLEEAKKWYGRAAAYKFPKAQERLEELRRGGAKAQKNREKLSRSNQKQAEESCTVM